MLSSRSYSPLVPGRRKSSIERACRPHGVRRLRYLDGELLFEDRSNIHWRSYWYCFGHTAHFDDRVSFSTSLRTQEAFWQACFRRLIEELNQQWNNLIMSKEQVHDRVRLRLETSNLKVACEPCVRWFPRRANLLYRPLLPTSTAEIRQERQNLWKSDCYSSIDIPISRAIKL